MPIADGRMRARRETRRWEAEELARIISTKWTSPSAVTRMARELKRQRQAVVNKRDELERARLARARLPRVFLPDDGMPYCYRMLLLTT